MNKDKLLRDLDEGYNYVMNAGDSADVMTVATEYYGVRPCPACAEEEH